MAFSKEERAAEAEFRPALEKFMRVMGMSDDTVMTHFLVIATGVSISDGDVERISNHASEGFTFTQQMGLVEFIRENYRDKVNKDDD